ncbi:uncharacterized protein LOC113279987 [Papaver somniferum]|uniref:uncharacterized protein LOC113279987 n=1 Tax=Papaver somniferum TaxID=3469 RepID=UPI000E7028C9|nr:uncharacterized protein LOC113279987 [Papaver somniferum]
MSQERAFYGKLAIKRSCKEAEWEFIIKGVGQEFYGGQDEASLIVEKYNHFFGRKVRVVKRNPERYTVECFYKEQFTCDWMFHAAPKTSNVKGHLFFKSYNGEHTCCAGYSDGTKTDPVTRELVKSLIFDQIEQNPNKKVRDIVREFKNDYGLELSYDHAHAGKELCLKELYGEDTKSYTDLVWGCVMEATGKNENNGKFPLVYDIVSSETIENWHWFLEKLKTILGSRVLTIISDRHEGLIQGIRDVFPTFHHGWCYQHLKNNVRGKTNKKKGEHGAAMDLFKQCFYSSMHEGFHQGMQKLKDMGYDGLHKFFGDLLVELVQCTLSGLSLWRHMFKNCRVVQLLDYGSKRLEKKVMAFIRAGVQWRISKSGDMEWEVFDGKNTHAVNIAKFQCSCRVWFTEQFPCDHAIACMHSNKINVYEYINPYFSIASFRVSYDRPIKPIPDYDKPIDVATGNLVNPPAVLGKKPGRLKKKQIPNTGNCHTQAHHNKTSCPHPPAKKQC